MLVDVGNYHMFISLLFTCVCESHPHISTRVKDVNDITRSLWELCSVMESQRESARVNENATNTKSLTCCLTALC